LHAITFLPVNFGHLLVREEEVLAVFSGQSCASHIRICEVAFLEVGSAQFCVSEICPDETNVSEYGST
jgi:hypothetical protein